MEGMWWRTCTPGGSWPSAARAGWGPWAGPGWRWPGIADIKDLKDEYNIYEIYIIKLVLS